MFSGSTSHHGLGQRAGVLLVILALLAALGGTSEARAASSAQPSITLSPTSGPPGTTVTIRGEVPGMTAAGHSAAVFTVCLGGCPAGFTDQGPPITWTGPQTFVSRFTIPRVPVLTAFGPLVPTDGVYEVGVTCVTPDTRGCFGKTEAQAKFRIVRAPRATRCVGKESCAELTLSSTRLYPGQVVRVRGWAPVTPVIGQPFAYEIVLSRANASAQVGQTQQSLSGNLSGTFRVPALADGLGSVGAGRYKVSLQYAFFGVAHAPRHRITGMQFTVHAKRLPAKLKTKVHVFYSEIASLAARSLDVRSLPTWKTLGALHVRVLQQSMPLPFAVRSGSPADFAYCVPGGIETTKDSGSTWRLIPTEPAAQRSMTTPYPIAYSNSTPAAQPVCQSVTWDPSAPNTLYAVFLAIQRTIGSAPPFFNVLYETRDFGATWTPVPVPSGYALGDFGGISVETAVHGDPVVALFSHQLQGSQIDGSSSQDATAIATTDGGATWRSLPLSCPSHGPCLRFGAMPGEDPGMGTSSLQPLMRSTDRGRTFTPVSWPSGNIYPQDEFPGQAELASLGGNEVLFVDALSQYPLRVSRDGGRTWQAIGLPLPPKSQQNTRYGNSPYGTLMLLPGGTLLAGVPPASPGVPTRWWTLSPGAARWRADRSLLAPATFGRLVISGRRLYWQRQTSNGLPDFTQIGLQSAPLP